MMYLEIWKKNKRDIIVFHTPSIKNTRYITGITFAERRVADLSLWPPRTYSAAGPQNVRQGPALAMGKMGG